MSSLPFSTTSSMASATPTTLVGDGFSPSQSLLSLSIAASSAAPIPISSSEDCGAGPTSSMVLGGTSNGSAALNKHQRRLSSAGKARRRFSDARDAAVRPSPATLSLATLSLTSSSPSSTQGSSISPEVSGGPQPSTSFSNVSSVIPPVAHSGIPISSVDTVASSLHVGSAPPNAGPAAGINSKPISIKNGKKRGMEHKCEGCSKIYRHPSCLIKHRWEHTPFFAQSSKYVLSKHQQVQLLEAAAILSHFSADSATGTSLPEDRSLWPSFLSGGSLPQPVGATASISGTPVPNAPGPTSTRAPSVGPRLHDYTIPTTEVTQVRPGLYMMGGSSAPSSIASPVPIPPNDSYSEVHSIGRGLGYGRATSLSSSSSSGRRVPSSSSYTSTSLSIPRSSLRSGSVFSESERSSSLEEEDDQEEDGRTGVYHDFEFDAELDVDGDTIIKRDGYAFNNTGDSKRKNFDEYGFEYENGLSSPNVKVAASATSLDSMKEEDWEMEMDMD